MGKETGRILICGTGNEMKGDEGVGLAAIRELGSEILDENVVFLDCGSAPQNHVKKVLKHKPIKVIVISALDIGKSSGTVELIESDVIRGLLLSRHEVKLELFMGYLRSALENRVFFIAVQPRSVKYGRVLSPECINSIPKIKDIVLDVIRL
jgi:hydrogenase 3 maturation protease